MTYQLKGGSILSNEVNEIGRWYENPMYKDVMTKYLTQWLLLGYYEVDYVSRDAHLYINFALDQGYVKFIEGNSAVFNLELTNKGRNFLNKGETNE
jgi:hypothetical protein